MPPEEDFTIPTETTATTNSVGSTPLPATQDMPKWIIVMVVTGIIAVFGYLIVSQNSRVADLKEQNATLQTNYNLLMTQFVFKDAEVSQLKEQKADSEKATQTATDSVVRQKTQQYTNKILSHETSSN